ncbi:permease prefix domain 1-containing protein [Peribacillus tepidiphilus]|uniref:permease prefix domain 1-containing protein n=1 Tax=Peribacillus tepidiphilus TaxID=2652445 RepID=UPI0035B52CF2
MNNPLLSTKTEKAIKKFVNNISVHSGIVSTENMTYLEEIKMNMIHAKKEMKQNIEQFKADTKDFLLKLQLSSNRNDDFQEEIQTHITEHVKELVSKGMTEEDALKVVLSEFEGIDFSELNQMKGEGEMMKYNEQMYEAIGVFYAGFLLLGGAIGFIAASWTGLILGIVIGIGLGNIAHGLTAALKKA